MGYDDCAGAMIGQAPRRIPSGEPYPSKWTIDGLIDQAALRFPDSTAIRWSGGTMSYADLARQAGLVAGGLRAFGASAGSVVAVVGARSAEACVAMLGVLKAGCAFLPLDDTLPVARLVDMIELARPAVAIKLPRAGTAVDGLLRCVDLSDLLAAAEPPPEEQSQRRGTDTAYVMFTSGSTGRPKGAVVAHRAVTRLAFGNSSTQVTSTDRVMHGCTIAFDGATYEIWPTLINGATVLIVEREMLLAPPAFRMWIREERPTVMFLTTAIFHTIAATQPDAFAPLRILLVGGEVLNPGLARDVLVTGAPGNFFNVYGPTENTAFTTTHRIDAVVDGTAIPIGRPVAHTTCYVLQPDGTLAPPGCEGELHIGGYGLAERYVGDPAATAQRFTTAAPTGTAERLYRTGDYVTCDADGTLHYRGRRDNQVKVRGVRIELDEISRLLVQHADVDDAVVIAVEDEASRSLVAFYTGKSVAPALREYVGDRLPAHYVPTAFHRLEQLPLTANGKVDREALVRHLADPNATDAPTVVGDPPAVVAAGWAAALCTDAGAPEDDFFAAGGDSLRAARMITQVMATLHIDGVHSQFLVRSLLRAPRLDSFTRAVTDVLSGVDTRQPEIGSDRWRRDVRLHPAPVTRTGPHRRTVRRILLTGATGFFGSYLLQALATSTTAEICCLVRASDDDAAVKRVLQAQDRYGHRTPIPANRLRVMAGDLRKRQFGWTEERWRQVADTVDAIYHSAAQVNFIYPYEWLRDSNVEGIRNVVDIARRRGTPVHYISTIAVLAGFGSAGITRVTEDTPLDYVERLSMGYPESKWVGEEVLRLAAHEGVPVNIFRPYEITGESVDGTWNTEAAICAFFKALVDMRTAPDLDLPLDFVPADYLARAVIHLATNEPSTGRTYHLTNASPAQLSTMVERLNARGYRIAVVPYVEWVRELVQFAAGHPTHPIVPFVPIFTDHAMARDLTVKELYRTGIFPNFNRNRAEHGLRSSGLSCPPVDARLLDRYLDYFRRVDYLPPARTQPGHLNGR